MIPVDDIDGWRTNAFEFGALLTEAQSVVTYRVLGMAGLWPVPDTEMMRMTVEKAPAFFDGWWSAALAMTRGEPAHAVVGAFTAPLARAAQSNRRRLERRGPGTMPGVDAD
ncbi:hypothetical protein [Salipiger mucosus]|uniref:Antifreeze protein n=1 Tax=Salipiger mucosus DSM 16094 TaxID=1123237 RepID=S9RCU5_9RHOB|nr:hypothetical protein [Salipiger mucosus]EPX75950.1 hypothetical protein Salmuc_02346 [Salipiger mucosus DSM 16094]